MPAEAERWSDVAPPDRSTGCSPTAAPWTAGWRSSMPISAAEGSPRCEPTPSSPGSDSPQTAPSRAQRCSWKPSPTCLTVTSMPPTPSSLAPPRCAFAWAASRRPASQLAERAVVAIERHDWHAAESFADEALAIVQAGHCEDYLTSTLVYAVAGRTAVHRGDVARPRSMSRGRLACVRCAPISSPPRPSSCSNSVTPISSWPTQRAPGPSSARSVTFSTTAPTWASSPSWPTSCSPWSTPSMTEQSEHRRSRSPSCGYSRSWPLTCHSPRSV